MSIERKPRRATVSVQLDESEEPRTLHDVARIILSCMDGPLAPDAIEVQAPFFEGRCDRCGRANGELVEDPEGTGCEWCATCASAVADERAARRSPGNRGLVGRPWPTNPPTEEP